MKKGVGVVALLFALVLVAPVFAFDVSVSPQTIDAEVLAGGFATRIVELHADRPVTLVARASPDLVPVIRLSRINDSALQLNVLPPIDTSEGTIEGSLILVAQGTNPLTSAGLQQAATTINVTIRIVGRATVPVDVKETGENISITPLSADSIIILVMVITGIITLNITLRGKQGSLRGKKK